MKFYSLYTIVGLASSAFPVSPRGRLLEVLDEPVILERLDPKTRELVRARAAIDETMDMYTFDLSRGWPTVISTPRGNLTLNISSMSNVEGHVYSFATEQDPNLRVQFSHDCMTRGISSTKSVPHLALSQYWYGTIASSARVTNKYHFVSPPVPFPSSGLFSGVSPQATIQCQRANAAVRFVVYHEPRGETLRALLARSPGRRLDPVFAFKLGRALLQSVKALHTAGIAYGNLMLETVFVDAARGHTIDLGGFISPRVSWIDTRTGKSINRNLSPARLSIAHLQSPWELAEGPAHRYTVRDDVYQAVQLVSIMLNGLDHESKLVRIGSTGNLAEYKLISPVLIPSLASNPLRCLPISVDSKTKLISKIHMLNAILFDIQSLEYDAVIDTLNEIAKIAQSRHIAPVMRDAMCDQVHRVSTVGVPSPAGVSRSPAPARRVSFPSSEPEVRTYTPEAPVSQSASSKSSIGAPLSIRAPVVRGSLKRGADDDQDAPATPDGAEPSVNKQRRTN